MKCHAFECKKIRAGDYLILDWFYVTCRSCWWIRFKGWLLHP